MNDLTPFTLAGVARASDPGDMLDQICEHFVEHAEVERTESGAVLTSELGRMAIRLLARELLIDLDCPSQDALQMARTSIAEHMFYFAGDEPFELNWAQTVQPTQLPNLHVVTVVSAEDVTPHMRRVIFACADVHPFIGGDMHARLLIPRKGRAPVWPGYSPDGRLAWPRGPDELHVRPYTIRAVDAQRSQLSIDFLQHPLPGIPTPGADFARDAQTGDVAALLGPGSGRLPAAQSLLMIGDESALPAIARIVAEVPAGTDIEAIIEVADGAEEQALPSAGNLTLNWLHRNAYAVGETGALLQAANNAIAATKPDVFVWAACEKTDIRAIRAILNKRQQDRQSRYVAWYWEK